MNFIDSIQERKEGFLAPSCWRWGRKNGMNNYQRVDWEWDNDWTVTKGKKGKKEKNLNKD